MSRPGAIAVVACTLVAVVAGCDRSSGITPTGATPTATTSKEPDVSQHESGPESPIAYGLRVPRGATQLGPLIRYRSARLIAAYDPELKAAIAQKAIEDQAKSAEAERDGTPIPSTLPTPEPRPSSDTFRLIENPPKPDSTISLMRIDGKPTVVVRRMVAQITAALPGSNLTTDNLAEYCRSVERQITSCRLAVRGLTAQNRDVRITMTVDPGKLGSRTSPPLALTRPVMTVSIEYVGEPRKGQFTKESNELGRVPEVDSVPERSGLVWPKMIMDAPRTTELVNGWVAPTTATILLSGYRPQFVTMTAARAADADVIAQQYAVNSSATGRYLKDVVEDLNEVTTTYTATTEEGAIARSTYVLSARGNYTTLFYYPAPK